MGIGSALRYQSTMPTYDSQSKRFKSAANMSPIDSRDRLDNLKADDVRIWLSDPARICQPDLISLYLSWLDPQERSRYHRFRFPQHRQEYLVAHALLRSCLSRYGPLQPWEWSFLTNAYGRPEIYPECEPRRLSEKGLPPLRFSLSHTQGLVACAVTRSAVGVDVEHTDREADLTAIAEASFSPPERADLGRLAGSAWRQRFFDLWTLREAFVKAQGMGLSFPLQQIAFRLTPAVAESIQFESGSAQNPTADWTFRLLSPTADHRLALAVRSRLPLHVQVGWTTPGQQPTQRLCIASEARRG